MNENKEWENEQIPSNNDLNENNNEMAYEEESPSVEIISETSIDEEADQTSMEQEEPTSTSSAQSQFDFTIPKARPIKEPKKHNRTPLLLVSCLLLGGIGGFAGSYLSSSLFQDDGNTVLYQSVERKDQDGNTIDQLSVSDVVSNTEQSVVEITTESVSTDPFFQQYVTEGAGSGVIISTDGYIVTNHHVIDGASKVTVRTKDGTEYNAKLIGSDKKTDLAVIKVEATNLSSAVFGSSSDLRVGDTAIAIGNPLGELGGTVTEGIVSALDREITIDGETMTLLQTDTAINSGNSGGGLFNDSGELIGIVNAKSSGSTVEGLGFAIPIDTAKPVIESLINNGYVTGRPQLGVSMINVTDEQTAFQAGVNELGVYIAKVNSDSAAEEAGLKVRDRVLEVEGQEIQSSNDIAKIVDSKKAGDTLTMVIERDGKKMDITATLKEEVTEQENTQKTSSNPFFE